MCDILPFWAERAFDSGTGALVGIVTHDLRYFDDVPRHSVLCSRILWTFAIAARLFPRSEWLQTGHRALRLLRGPFWDQDFGGIHFSIGPDGAPVSARKQTYAQAFAIYGLAEWHATTGEPDALRAAQELFELVERHAREPSHAGYIEALDRDWTPLRDQRLSGKDLNAPKSNNTHLHLLEAYARLFEVWPDACLRARLVELLQLFLDRILTARPFPHCQLFFDLDWRPLLHRASFGHDIESSWLVWEAARTIGDGSLLNRTREAALALADSVLLHGLDEDGAVLCEGDATRITNTEKHWWAQAEAVVGFLNAYQISQRPAYLEAALRVWAFIEEHQIDRTCGEWYAVLDRAGRPLPDYPQHPESQKIGPWKCPYHNARTCIEILRRVPDWVAT